MNRPSTISDTHADSEAESPPWLAENAYFYSLKSFYRRQFGGDAWKISLDAGCTCPNRDGSISTGGCIFCDPESFSPSRRGGIPSIAGQLQEGIRRQSLRGHADRFIAYFQPASNTYGDVETLRRAYSDAISHPNVVGLVVGTRPDCAGDAIVDVLAELAQKTWVAVEFGLQTIHDRTLDWLRRGHHADAFFDAYERCRRRGLNVGAHVILGLPGESRDDMLTTARTLAKLDLHSIKPHNLYAVRGTPLADLVAARQVRLPELDEYVGWLVDFLEALPERFVIERLCGDAPREYFLGPAWCLDKSAVRRAVEAEFRRRGSRQGAKRAKMDDC